MTTKPKKVCSEEGCGRPTKARGWCDPHYKRWWRHGSPDGGRHNGLEGQRKFYREVVLAHSGKDCLIWPYRTARGYGRMMEGGKDQVVSRLVCQDVHGPPPSPKHEAAHSCGRGHEGCVAPSHLRWATHKENIQDRFLYGRPPSGSGNGNSKLTDAVVREIRRLARSVPQKDIASRFGVSKGSVSMIVSRKTWAHVKNEPEEGEE
jgi:hypothetical protein